MTAGKCRGTRCREDNVLRQQVRQVPDLNAVLCTRLITWIYGSGVPIHSDLPRDTNYHRRTKIPKKDRLDRFVNVHSVKVKHSMTVILSKMKVN